MEIIDDNQETEEIETLRGVISELEKDKNYWQDENARLQNELLSLKARFAFQHEAYGRLLGAYYSCRQRETGESGESE